MLLVYLMIMLFAASRVYTENLREKCEKFIKYLLITVTGATNSNWFFKTTQERKLHQCLGQCNSIQSACAKLCYSLLYMVPSVTNNYYIENIFKYRKLLNKHKY